MEVLAKRLKWLREQKRLSQKEIAAEIGMSLNGYQKIEGGERNPKLEILVTLSDIFNVSTDFLLGKINYTNEIEEIPFKIKHNKERIFELQDKSTKLLYELKQTKNEYMHFSIKDDLVHYNTVNKSNELDDVLMKERHAIDQEMSALVDEMGELVYEYFTKLLEIPNANPSKDSVLKNHMPFDFEITQHPDGEFAILVYGRGLGIIGFDESFDSEEEANDYKNELLRRMYNEN
ncbi:hypothetical protein CHH83_02325 [Bacillus sp. 7586-K]|nr:hypothetical protein CHH83_02325 [Bacillus sp. 7586-K]